MSARHDWPRTAANDPLPTPPLEAEYPAGWWIWYVVAVILSVIASAIWPGVWFGG